jgi:hypothetical protein
MKNGDIINNFIAIEKGDTINFLYTNAYKNNGNFTVFCSKSYLKEESKKLLINELENLLKITGVELSENFKNDINKLKLDIGEIEI